MSETPASTPPFDPTQEPQHTQSYPVRLAYAVYGAMTQDMGCIIGAVGFIILLFGSVVFAAQLTPCTSAGGIPCAH